MFLFIEFMEVNRLLIFFFLNECLNNVDNLDTHIEILFFDMIVILLVFDFQEIFIFYIVMKIGVSKRSTFGHSYLKILNYKNESGHA